MDHEAIRHSIAAYALDALSDAERGRTQQELLDHLPGCPDCTAMLRDFRETVSDLALASGPVRLSSDLEERVMAAVRSEASSPPAVTVSPRRRLVIRIASAAAAAALVASWITTGVIAGQLQRERDARTRFASALSIAGDPGARVTMLRGERGSLVVAVRSDGRVALIGGDVEPAPEGRLMELWLFDGSKPVPVGTFSARDGTVVLLAQVAPAAYTGAAVTFERSFVRAPTGSPAYQGSLGA